ncbi:NAD(P)/FAD-dependent oxidoreductase [Mycobacterium sp. Aquia_216]|uniref:dihydrolipoyl dehydrogenase family protein n=1 Tax=Mycobacterium sp. Aquia_216 TaxID=2991729 RepID=UPI00227C9687|nr:NAD(P)/FAD-dependent oxidoreductase [Mycobacterium sp. Aquia_216]WAJ45306.1 NAD(P)/FAD-dependent oxidoreductase [Mycobacterium sp. Aquia_216]
MNASAAAQAAEATDRDRIYDVVVVGAGPVGINAAGRVRAGGLSVALIERELVGGECRHWGCIPSKALLRPVLALADARRVEGSREAVTGSVSASGVFARRDRYVTNWDDTPMADAVAGMGVDLFRGHGRLDGPCRVGVTTFDGAVLGLTARHGVMICTGSSAMVPDVPGVAEAKPWTNRRATDSSSVPRRLAIVGSGGVATEMATAWQGLGSAVTLLSRGASLLPRMEPFVGEYVARGLTEAGVDIRTRVSVAALHRSHDAGPVRVVLDNGDEIEVDEILCATGRVPNTADIGLETVGLQPSVWIDVDDTCLVRGVDGEWLYALGDANHRALLTHQGMYQARIAAAGLGARAHGKAVDTAPWGQHVATADNLAVPQAFFTDPEAGSVGLTVAQAHEGGYRFTTVDVDMGQSVPGANLFADGYVGWARMLVDLDQGYILGVTMVGPGVTELLHSATIAVAGQLTIDRLWHAVPCFPTLSEVWLRLVEAYRDSPGATT